MLALGWSGNVHHLKYHVLLDVLALGWSGNMIEISSALAFLNMLGVVKAAPQARPKTT